MNKPPLSTLAISRNRQRRRGRISATLKRERVDRRLYIVGAILVILSILAHQPLLLIVGVTMLIILGIIDTWGYYCLHNLHYQRHLSEQRVLFGEKITFGITLENEKILPLPLLEISDTLPTELQIEEIPVRRPTNSNLTTLDLFFSLRWYERVTKYYTMHCLQRGVHKIGPVRLRSSDLFGFISREIQFTSGLDDYILVYPLVLPLSSFQLPSRRPFGDLRTPRRLLEDPSRVVGVRQYVHGDNLRRVDWKATARTLSLQSKVYEETTTYTLSLFLNASTQLDMHYGIHPEWRELSICAAASITNWAMDMGYAVGLYSNTSMFIPDEDFDPSTHEALEKTLAEQMRRRSIRLPATSNAEQRKRIMETLARIQSYFGTTLEEVLQSERHHLGTGSTVVVITTSLGEQLIEQLASLHRGGHAVSILFVGDTPLPTRVANIPIHHIGGTDTWKTLQEQYSRQQQTDAPVTEQGDIPALPL
ncbi:MAG TPA: DUF58 domain-containing protein [Dictyobacter sp.]|jgi:uncharacterized protein (DUF58 family)|nr:DUF58 domain-containing protein [Dictyobacter sp.]